MFDKNIHFSASYKEYESEAKQYILSLNKRSAQMAIAMENATRMFTEFVYGYLPTADKIKWPVLTPNYDTSIVQEQLVPFNEAYSYGKTNCIVHFFVDDNLFTRVFRNPIKYLSFLKSCRGVIGTDLSQYTDMPFEMRYRHAWCNAAMSAYLQHNNVNLFPNITWSKSDSFRYCILRNLKNSVIAINSNAVHCSNLALYRWRKGYNFVVDKLHPIHIIRYGAKVDGELTEISSYHVNERLKALRHGR